MAVPADLYAQLIEARDSLRDVRRVVVELAREYHRLDAAELAVDELGDPLTAHEALTSTHAALADVQNALTIVDDAFDVAQRYTARLKER